MGSSFSCENQNDAAGDDYDNQFRWPEDKRNVYAEAVASGNPKVIDFKKYTFPVEDPIALTVECESTN